MRPGFDFSPPREPWPDGFAPWHGPFPHSFEFSGWTALLSLVFAVLVYFVPTFVAYRRRHHNRAAIALLNLFLGWTFFGWALALVWAATPVLECLPTGSRYAPVPGEGIGTVRTGGTMPQEGGEAAGQQPLEPRPGGEPADGP